MRAQANTLCQLRTGINRLNSSLGKIGGANKRGQGNGRSFSVSLWQVEHCAHYSQNWGDKGYLLGGWSGKSKDGILANQDRNDKRDEEPSGCAV